MIRVEYILNDLISKLTEAEIEIISQNISKIDKKEENAQVFSFFYFTLVYLFLTIDKIRQFFI